MITFARYPRRIHLSEMQQGNQIHPKDFGGKTSHKRVRVPLSTENHQALEHVNAEQNCTETCTTYQRAQKTQGNDKIQWFLMK